MIFQTLNPPQLKRKGASAGTRIALNANCNIAPMIEATYRSRVFPVTVIHEKATRLGLAYLIIGGHAINAYGEPRATLDVDLVVRKDDRTGWSRLLEAEGFRQYREEGSFAQFSPPDGVPWRLDLMLVNSETFGKLTASAQTVKCFGIETRVPSPEHLVAMKLHAIRHGPAERFEKDFGDILTLARNGKVIPDSGSLKEYSNVTERPRYMSNSEQNSKPDGGIAGLKENTSPYALDLPLAPDWWSRAPAGTWEDGYRLSLAALQMVKNRPEIFAQRDARMCTVEFEM